MWLFFYVNAQQSHPKTNQQIKHLTIFPDQIKIRGDQLSGQGSAQGISYNLFYRIKSKSEKAKLQNVKKIIDVDVQITQQQLIKGPRNPGEFNLKAYDNHRNIFYTLSIDTIKNIRMHPIHKFSEAIHRYRIDFIKYLNKLPKWLRIHCQSLLVGYSNSDESQLFQTLSVLGVIHLFSLSGLHVFLLIQIIQKLCSFLRINKERVDWFLLIVLPIFGIFVGLKTGISRAIVLSLLLIIFKKMNFQICKLDIFSLSVLICLILNPFALVEMGGQLSFILSGALIYLKNDSILAQTIKMNLLSLPIICYYTYQFSILIIFMNLIFVPIFTYLILPTTILAALLPETLSPIWRNFNQLFELMYRTLDQLAQRPEFNLVVGQFPVITVVGLIILGLYNLEHANLWNRYLKTFLMAFSIVVIFMKFPLFGKVSIIDVGQGDSILVTTPFMRKTVLIDTAGKLGFPQQLWQKKKITTQVEKSTIPHLRSLGISKIDYVFLSHKDSDHIGNLATLLEKFPVEQVNFGIGLQQNNRIKSIINDHPNVKYTALKRGDSFEIGKTSWQVLWPNKSSVGENGDSLTLLANIGNKNWLFTGDLDIDNEQKILDLGTFKLDFLKAGHHGSKTGTSNRLLKETEPKIAIISAGINNRYGHPNKETIERLDKHAVKHFNTADYGMITWYYYPIDHRNGLNSFLRVN